MKIKTVKPVLRKVEYEFIVSDKQLGCHYSRILTRRGALIFPRPPPLASITATGQNCF